MDPTRSGYIGMVMEANVAVAFLETRAQRPHERVEPRDALASARGIAIGLALSVVFWVLVAFLVVHT
jgi:uncharacterized membrane protein YccC